MTPQNWLFNFTLTPIESFKMFSTVYLFFGTDTEVESAPEKTTSKKRKRTSTSAGKVQVATLTQTSVCHLGENPEDVAAAHVNDGEMARGEVALPPQQLEPPQQLLDETTYVMGGVICGKTYMVIMKFIKSWH